MSYRALWTNVTDPHFTFALVRASHTESTSELINNPRKSHSEVGHGTKYVQSTLTEESQYLMIKAARERTRLGVSATCFR